jgi:hypothetical protein
MRPAVCRVHVVKDSLSLHVVCFSARDSVGDYGVTRWVRLSVTPQLLAASPSKCLNLNAEFWQELTMFVSFEHPHICREQENRYIDIEFDVFFVQNFHCEVV